MRFTLLLLSMLVLLGLEQAVALVRISEFLADNADGLRDENGDRSDWIEIHNGGPTPVNLEGWWITDNRSQPAKWRFPAVVLPPDSYLLIWASSKDRRRPDAPLHTNFALSRGGEYLGLYRPDATTGQPVLVDEYRDTGTGFPPQLPDISYGRNISPITATPVAAGTTALYRVLPDTPAGEAAYNGHDYAAGQVGTGRPGGWNVSPSFDDSSWRAGQTGIGYDANGGLLNFVGGNPDGNCQSTLRDVNTSLLFRRTFTLAGTSSLTTAKLRIRYEDGFVAWINGVEIARANFTGTPVHNSRSTVALDETIVESWTEIAFPTALLNEGANVLAIQGLNSTAGSSDFLILPEVVVTSVRPDLATAGYLNPPTPGTANSVTSAGPLLYHATPEDPDVPRPTGTAASPPLLVTVKVMKTRDNITDVRVIPRLMFAAEGAAVKMNDRGETPDSIAGDGVYSAFVPTDTVGAGQMLRWRFEAVDAASRLTQLPSFHDPLDSPRYFGTVALTPSTDTSRLPVLHWFVANTNANGPADTAFRASFYYLGNFYDNTGHELRGQSSMNFPKKGYNFDSNDNHRFLWREGEGRVKDLKLVTNYADKTKARNTLSHEIGMMAGAAWHFAYPVRVQLNGGFHGVMDIMEDGDDRFLERNGLDPLGALYKIYAEDMISSAEKKTRKEEPNTDLAAFVAGLNTPGGLGPRRTFGYDNIDIAATINYLAVRNINSDRDHGAKNFYLYRDTEGSGEWQPVIWDVDLSHGRNWTWDKAYFNDALVPTNGLTETQSQDHALYSLVYESEELREMFTRRLRTLMDEILQPPGTTGGFIETRLREIAAAIDPDPAVSTWTDGDLDAAKWGFDPNFFPNRPREEVERVIANYLGPRRTFLFNTGPGRPLFFRPRLSPNAGNSTPIPDHPQINLPGLVLVDSVEANPNSINAAMNQSHEFLVLRNPGSQAVDLSGWRLAGAVDHVFVGGTVIPSGPGTAAADYRGLLHVAKDARAFRARPAGPGGGQRRFVQGGYSGQLSARGETVELRDPRGLLVHSFTYAAAPTPAQRFLRISEIQYHPADPRPAETLALPGVTDNEFEYLEFVNTGEAELDLTGSAFTAGLTYTFPPQTLAPGARLILAKNPAAFALRYPSVTTTVLGPYEGQLDNAGERLEITDTSGEVVLDFEYKDGWYPATDGSGHSLVLRDLQTPPDRFSSSMSWGTSLAPTGSPGTGDAALAQSYRGWDNFHFTSAERDDPAISGPEADPDQDGRPNWMEYALGRNPRVVDADGVDWSPVTSDGNTRAGLRYHRPTHALDLNYVLLAGNEPDAASMLPVAATGDSVGPTQPGIEQSMLREESPAPGAKRFFRLRVTLSP